MKTIKDKVIEIIMKYDEDYCEGMADELTDKILKEVCKLIKKLSKRNYKVPQGWIDKEELLNKIKER